MFSDHEKQREKKRYYKQLQKYYSNMYLIFMSFVAEPKTDGQNIYRIDDHWLDESSQKKSSDFYLII